MKKNLRIITGGIGAIVTLALASCAYDPYYGGSSSGSYSSYGGGYGGGYGSGYGYGGSSFSTSLFVSTGDSRWGYDPYCRSYYDYNRRAYYDPYLYGYYPVGYRPPVIVGVPHPHGWRSGSRYCPPPRHIRNSTLANYRDRESAYRSSNHSWARQVRQQPLDDSRNRYDRDRDDNRSNWDRNRSNSRDPRSSSSFDGSNSRDPRSGRNDSPAFNRGSDNDRNRSIQNRSQPRVPSGYNTPIEISPSQPIRPSRQPEFSRSNDRRDSRGNSNAQRSSSRSSEFERQAPAPSQRGGNERSNQRSGSEKRERSDDKDRGNSREGRVRGLGQG